MDTIARTISILAQVEEKFAKIQENPALNGAENGLTNEEVEMLDKLIEHCGAASFAADAIAKRLLPK